MGKGFIVGLAVCTLLITRSTDMPLTNDGVSKCYSGGLLQDNVYIGLHSAEPSESSPNELSGTGYARLEITGLSDSANAEWTVTTNVASLNAAQEWTAAAPVAWGDPTHVGYWSAASGGDLLAWSTIPNVDPIAIGSRVYANANDFTVTIPLS